MNSKVIYIVSAMIGLVIAGCAMTAEPPSSVVTPESKHSSDPGEEHVPVGQVTSQALIEADTDHALVYFANALPVWAGIGSKSAKVQVFVDGEPVGLLPDHTYTVTKLEEGYHDVYWGQWMYFEAGRTYLLLTSGNFDEWVLDDPARLAELECEEAVLSPANREMLVNKRWRTSYANQREKSWKRYERFIEEAGIRPPEQLLPLTVKDAACQGGPDDKSIGGFLSSGTVTVDEKGIRCEMGKKVLQVPASDIRKVTFGHYRGGPFVRVAYGDPENLQYAEFKGLLVREYLGFRKQHFPSEHYNLIFLAILDSAERSRIHDESAASLTPGVKR